MLLAYVPTPQLVHVGAPAADHLPASQSVHALDPELDDRPATHVEQLTERLEEKVPPSLRSGEVVINGGVYRRS